VAAPKPDYLSRDYAGLRASLLQYASQTNPEWQPASEGDFGLMLLELFSYMGDIMSYYTDRAQFENYITTATQRDSVLNLAYLLGYIPNSGSPATGTVPLTSDKGQAAITVPAGTQIKTNRIEALDGPLTFETNDDVIIPANPAGTTPAVNASVTEGETVSYAKIGESNGLPSQNYLLPDTGVYSGSIQIFVEDGLGSTIINPGPAQVVAREWTVLDHLLDADPTDKVFETRLSDDSTVISFGDDINGAIPATGLQIFATYRHGYGASGNVAAGMVRLINDRTLGGVHVAVDTTGAVLSSEMTGGSDPETTDSIRYNAPRVYRTQNRAVTLDDYSEIALGTQGVTRANVVAGTFTSVTVFITGSDGGAPSDLLKAQVTDRFNGKTLLGVTVQVAAPTFVPVNFGSSADPIVIDVKDQYSVKTVRAAVKREIRSYVSTMQFDEPLAVGKVYRRIMDVEGVKSVEIDVMARDDAVQVGTTKITPKPWEIFTVGNITTSMTGGVG
jgi:uncharacterized phage protein gp47/JayE